MLNLRAFLTLGAFLTSVAWSSANAQNQPMGVTPSGSARSQEPKAKSQKQPLVRASVLATITTDQNQDTARLLTYVENGELLGIRLEIKEGPPRYQFETKTFLLKDIATKTGVVLLRKMNRDILLLRGKIDLQGGRARLELSYLANGLWGTYETCPFSARQDNTGRWALYNSRSERMVNELFVRTFSLGVNTVEGICN